MEPCYREFGDRRISLHPRVLLNPVGIKGTGPCPSREPIPLKKIQLRTIVIKGNLVTKCKTLCYMFRFKLIPYRINSTQNKFHIKVPQQKNPHQINSRSNPFHIKLIPHQINSTSNTSHHKLIPLEINSTAKNYIKSIPHQTIQFHIKLIPH